MSGPSNSERKRPLRSYVVRSGRLTSSQRKAIDDHWQQYGIEYRQGLIDWSAQYPHPGPLTIEIGFGMGASLIDMAREQAGQNFLGIDVHRPGIGKVLHEINSLRLPNLRLMEHDAKEVLVHCFSPASVDRILVFFPDPWPKKRHHKRRLIQAQFTELLGSRLKPGGSIHLATDWQAYAEHMMEVLEACDGLVNCCGEGNYWLDPQRPETKFEQRGRRLGHGVWDLKFQKAP